MIIVPEIPIQFTSFPDNYINDVRGWAFDKQVIEDNKGKLLTLDIDFGDTCSLNCPLCFRKNNSVDDKGKKMQYDDIVHLILQAKALGLRSVKFLGAGDPFENREILKLLRFLKSQDVIPLVFTKGQILGDDALVRKYHQHEGVANAEDLIDELFKLDVSVLFGVNSFDDELQGSLVGKSKDFIKVRNRALELLVKRGFNQGNPTRLAIINSPITKHNIHEAMDIYKWSRVRNLYCVITSSMVSGRGKGKLRENSTPSQEQLINLYSDIYNFNVETNLQSIEQVEEEGISSYAGAHPCNQVSTGMYVSLFGRILSCPGTETQIEGDFWEKPLEDVWRESNNIKLAGTFNCGCPAKVNTILSKEFYSEVAKKVMMCEI